MKKPKKDLIETLPDLIPEPESNENSNIPVTNASIGDHEFARIYLVWTIGLYPNGLPHLDLRAVTTSMLKAQLYSKMLRKDKEFHGEDWQRVAIEPRVCNHLYGVNQREFKVAMGKM